MCLGEWSETPEDTFCRVVAHLLFKIMEQNNIQMSHDMTKCVREFPTRSDSNWPAQLQKLAWGLKFWLQKLRDITLSRQRTTKGLIRLRGCAGWSAPLLFAYDIRHVFSWPSLITKTVVGEDKFSFLGGVGYVVATGFCKEMCFPFYNMSQIYEFYHDTFVSEYLRVLSSL